MKSHVGWDVYGFFCNSLQKAGAEIVSQKNRRFDLRDKTAARITEFDCFHFRKLIDIVIAPPSLELTPRHGYMVVKTDGNTQTEFLFCNIDHIQRIYSFLHREVIATGRVHEHFVGRDEMHWDIIYGNVPDAIKKEGGLLRGEKIKT